MYFSWESWNPRNVYILLLPKSTAAFALIGQKYEGSSISPRHFVLPAFHFENIEVAPSLRLSLTASEIMELYEFWRKLKKINFVWSSSVVFCQKNIIQIKDHLDKYDRLGSISFNCNKVVYEFCCKFIGKWRSEVLGTSRGSVVLTLNDHLVLRKLSTRWRLNCSL